MPQFFLQDPERYLVGVIYVGFQKARLISPGGWWWWWVLFRWTNPSIETQVLFVHTKSSKHTPKERRNEYVSTSFKDTADTDCWETEAKWYMEQGW